MQLPQEIEVRYVIPALRKAFATELIDNHGYSQRQAASVLDISPAAISQYVTGERADTVELPETVKQEVQRSVQQVTEKDTSLLEALYRLTEQAPVQELTCKLHKRNDDVPRNCTLCMEEP